MIRLADFQKNFAALRGSNMLDQLGQQTLANAPTPRCCGDHDILQFPLRIDSMGDEECKNSRRGA